MLSWIREKFGTLVIGGIIGFIAFVFVFYGVFSPKATRGLHEGAVAGTVNGDRISIPEFNRELNRRLEFFKGLAGGQITDEQMKAFRIREMVFNDLAARRVMIQEAEKKGLVPATEEIRDQIREIPAFQKNGKFDLITYKQTLEANQYTPSSFGNAVREDLAQQKWREFFRSRVHVSEDELKREFLSGHNKRDVKYVVLTPEAVKKDVPIQDKEVDQFLANPTQLKLAQSKYEAGKETTYKGQKFEDVQKIIARGILASQKVEESQKKLQSLGEQVAAQLSADKTSDARVNVLLKPYNLKVQNTGLRSRDSLSIPQLGDSTELAKDAFAEKSVINPKQGGKAKLYPQAGRILVAVVTDVEKPNLTDLEKERATLTTQIANRKMQALYSGFVQDLMAKSKIETNPSVVQESDT